MLSAALRVSRDPRALYGATLAKTPSVNESSKNTCVVASVVVLLDASKRRTLTWMCTARPEYQPG